MGERIDNSRRAHLCMEGIADTTYLDSRVLRNPFLQDAPPLGGVQQGEPVMHYGPHHRQRMPYILPAARDEHEVHSDAPQKDMFEMAPAFDCGPSKPWRSGLRPPPK